MTQPNFSAADDVSDQIPDNFYRDVVDGLARAQKRVPSKYFYDQRGSQLFDRICDLEEYYPTRTEIGIMQDRADEIAETIGPEPLVIELGAGSGLKTRLLLKHLQEVAGYVPVDISREHMTDWTNALAREFPALPIHVIHADFTADFPLPDDLPAGRRVAWFPGSTVGNFTRTEAAGLLARIARMTGPEGGMLIGVDLKKDPEVLEAAYNDRQGVTRAFNLNLLERMRRELGADVDPEQFEHEARYNDHAGRIEMHLVSKVDQTISVGDARFEMRSGESIHTENSYKYTPEEFAELAHAGGFRRTAYWTDDARLFSVQYFEPANGQGMGARGAGSTPA